MTFFAIRRARLRPAYAYLYPRIAPEVWIGARTAVRALRKASPHAKALELAGRRILPDEHFEFRGGVEQRREVRGIRSRSTDQVMEAQAKSA